MSETFSRLWRNGVRALINRSFTVAVTARELHPLPYSPVAAAKAGNEHLKAIAKNLS